MHYGGSLQRHGEDDGVTIKRELVPSIELFSFDGRQAGSVFARSVVFPRREAMSSLVCGGTTFLVSAAASLGDGGLGIDSVWRAIGQAATRGGDHGGFVPRSGVPTSVGGEAPW